MRRRSLLLVGAGAGTILALAGGMLAMLAPGLREGRLSQGGREVFAAVAQAVLSDFLPADPAERAQEIQAHLYRLDATIAAMPPTLQSEIGELVTLLASAPARVAVTGLRSDWPQASVAELQAMLQGMRLSSLQLRQQIYHALRNLTNAAYFADPGAWRAIGYPGPQAI